MWWTRLVEVARDCEFLGDLVLERFMQMGKESVIPAPAVYRQMVEEVAEREKKKWGKSRGQTALIRNERQRLLAAIPLSLESYYRGIYIDMFAGKMKRRMDQREQDGVTGWNSPTPPWSINISRNELQHRIRKNADAGEWFDVAGLAFVAWFRQRHLDSSPATGVYIDSLGD